MGNTFPSVNLISSEIPPKECKGTKSTLSPQEQGLGSSFGRAYVCGLLGRHLEVTSFGPFHVKPILAIAAWTRGTHGTVPVSPLGQSLQRGFRGGDSGLSRLQSSKAGGGGEEQISRQLWVCSRCNQLFFSPVPRSDLPADRRAAGGAAPPGPAALRRPVLRVSRSH